MKNCIYTILLCCCTWLCGAQIVSPGTGVRITFADLTTDPSGAVTTTAPGCYAVHQNLTLSANDTMVLNANLQSVTFDGNITVLINGAIECVVREDSVDFIGTRADSTQDYVAFRFENADPSVISNLRFTNGKNILLSESNITFERCEFTNFTDKVINYLSCNPIIRNCYFHDNQAAAITSAANFMGSPKILDSYFYNNVLSNTNNPQINLGPGAADTIYIVGNHIEGVASTMSGGIAIANLMSLGNTNAIVRNNIVEHNRYGYTQNGNNINTLIEDNQFLFNDLEVNPNNGGSGISIYGYSTSCAAKIRRNLIRGNLWGVTTIYYHATDMGTAEDPGGNVIYDNGNGGVTYALYNNAFSPMSAVGNYWGGNSDSLAEEVIFHYPDQPANNLGVVTYLPIMTLEPVALSCQVYSPNMVAPVEYYVDPLPNNGFRVLLQSIDSLGYFYFFYDALVNLELPLGVEDSVISDEYFEGPWQNRIIRYLVYTPHGDTAVWKVVLNELVPAVPEYTAFEMSVYPNPVSGGQVTIKSENPETMDVQIYDMTGKCMYAAIKASNILQVSTANWPAGLYFIKTIQGVHTHTTKLTISH